MKQAEQSRADRIPPFVHPCWFYAADVAKYDPTKDKSNPDKNRAEPAPAVASTESLTEPDAHQASRVSSGPSIQPITWEQFSEADSIRLERMHTRVAAWRLGSDSATYKGPPAHSFNEVPEWSSRVLIEPDAIFEVDVARMLRYALYWPSPVYEVRRALWFAPTGPNGKWLPCDANLSRQTEEGYLRIKPWLTDPHTLESTALRSTAQAKSTQLNAPSFGADSSKTVSPSTREVNKLTPSLSYESLERMPRQTLFGSHLGKYVLYDPDGVSAYLREDSAVAKVQQTIFAAMGAVYAAAGMRLIRGYQNLPEVIKEREFREAAAAKAKAAKSSSKHGSNDPKASLSLEDTISTAHNPNSTAHHAHVPDECQTPQHLVLVVHGIGAKLSEQYESISFINDVSALRKGISDAISISTTADPSSSGNLNAVKDPPAKATNAQMHPSAIAVLPIHWRQSIKFGVDATPLSATSTTDDEQGAFSLDDDPSSDGEDDRFYDEQLKERGPQADTSTLAGASQVIGEQDITTFAQSSNAPELSRRSTNRKSLISNLSISPEDTHLPALDEIMLSGVPTIRTLLTDVFLDVLLYMTPRYRTEIIATVASEMNRIYRLFRSRHPNFTGRVSLFGHSLGSVICLDILSSQLSSHQAPVDITSEDATVPHLERCLQILQTTISNQSSPAAKKLLPFCNAAKLRDNQTHQHEPHGDHKKSNVLPAGKTSRRWQIGSELPPENVPIEQHAAVDFKVDNFFMAGSPAGYFLLLQGEKLRAWRPQKANKYKQDRQLRMLRIAEAFRSNPGMALGWTSGEVKRPQCASLYNLFSIYDPVAARVEPLVSRTLVRAAPARIPYHKGGLRGLQNEVENAATRAFGVFRNSSGYISNMLRAAIGKHSGSASKSSLQDGSVSDIPSDAANSRQDTMAILNPRYSRVDFTLQQGILENPYFAALSTHMSYWSDLDIACVPMLNDINLTVY